MQKNKTIIVENSVKEKNTRATILIQNKINYIPCVSVIIPVYNMKRYLHECLDSVLNQTLKEIEIICIDDGSTDNSLEILKEYASKDKRISVLTQQNLYVGVARNAGLAVAKGEYIGFVDSDDKISPQTYECLYKKAKQNKEIDIVVCSYTIQNDVDKSLQKHYGLNKNFIDEFNTDEQGNIIVEQNKPILQITNPAPWNKIYSRKFLLDNKIKFPRLAHSEDVPFTFCALAKAYKIGILYKDLNIYRVGTGVSATDTKDRLPLVFYDACVCLKENLIRCNVYDKFKTSYINATISCCLYNFDTFNNFNKDKLREFFNTKIFPDLGLNKKNINTLYPLYVEKCKMLLALSNIPKVSVIIPIYNASSYLRECLDSVINQTLVDIEIICINDGSTDDSLDIIKEYATNDVRIRYIDKPNAGYGQTINCGIDQARGEYIGIVEPDDFIKPKMYETLYKKAKESNLDIIKSDYKIFVGDGKNRIYTDKPLSTDNKIYNHITNIFKDLNIFLLSNINPNGIFKKTFLLKHNIRLNETPGASFQDNGFWFQTFCFAKRIMFIKDSFYMIRRDNPNSSVKNKAKVFCMCDEYDFILDILNKHPAIKKYVLPMYVRNKYSAYIFTLNRVANKFKKIFLKRFAEDFYEYQKSDYITSDLFNKYDRDVIFQITTDYKRYYSKKCRDNFIKNLFSIDRLNDYTHIVNILGIKHKIVNKKKKNFLVLVNNQNQIISLLQKLNEKK